MAHLSKVRQCARLPRNSGGRDFVVGDLHGHRELLEFELDRVDFDPGRDRVLSVGDLIDRGPDSLGTLALLEQPWFHAVLGNHELMLLNYLGYFGSRLKGRKSYAQGPGAWILDALEQRPRRVSRLADRLSELPLTLQVADDMPYGVMHGDLHLPCMDSPASEEDPMMSVHKAEAVTSSRVNLAGALAQELLSLPFHRRQVRISARPIGPRPLTYVGHSPVPQIIIHNSCVYIDQGVCLRGSRSGGSVPPTLLEHRQFAHWVRGVAEARRPELCAA